MEEEELTPVVFKKKHFIVQIKYDDPYPREFKSEPIQARSADRAVVFAFRAFKKTRKPRKRMPKVFNFKVIQL